MFAIAHLDFTFVLWPYYVLVAAIYGTVTYLTNPKLPAVVLHTCGNIFTNFDLWLHGRAEWQTGSVESMLIWQTGIDKSLWTAGLFLGRYDNGHVAGLYAAGNDYWPHHSS